MGPSAGRCRKKALLCSDFIELAGRRSPAQGHRQSAQLGSTGFGARQGRSDVVTMTGVVNQGYMCSGDP
jgi:hypothetical protein